MSGQYLEAHAFLETLRDKGVPYTETLVNLMQYAVIEDVAPVIHAHWMPIESTVHVEKSGACSECGEAWPLSDTEYFYYCPKCGAIMDEEVE